MGINKKIRLSHETGLIDTAPICPYLVLSTLNSFAYGTEIINDMNISQDVSKMTALQLTLVGMFDQLLLM